MGKKKPEQKDPEQKKSGQKKSVQKKTGQEEPEQKKTGQKQPGPKKQKQQEAGQKEQDQQESVEQKPESNFLKELMSISGYPGLYRFISQARNGIIVESLEDKKRMQAFASMKVSALEEIAVFTEEEDIPLAKVLKMIHDKESGGETISPKSDPASMKAYFAEVLPSYDRERVYISDIKKILNWYNILHKHGLLKFEEESPSDTSPSDGSKAV